MEMGEKERFTQSVAGMAVVGNRLAHKEGIHSDTHTKHGLQPVTTSSTGKGKQNTIPSFIRELCEEHMTPSHAVNQQSISARTPGLTHWFFLTAPTMHYPSQCTYIQY